MNSWIGPSLLFGLLSFSASAQYIYPNAKKIPQTEMRFNTVIEDPYKWMENLSDSDLWSWIDEQKDFTSSILDAGIAESFAERVIEIRKIKAEEDKLISTQIKTQKPFAPGLEEDLNMGRSNQRFFDWSIKDPTLKGLEPKNESATYEIKQQTVHGGDLTRVIISNKTDNKVADVILVKFYEFVAWADDNSFYYVSDLDERIGGGRPALFKHTVGEIQSEDQLIVKAKNSNSDLVIHKAANRFFLQVDDTISSIQLSSGKVTNPQLLKGEVVEVQEKPEATAMIRSFAKANFGEIYKLRLRDGQRTLFVSEQKFVVASTKYLDENNTLLFGLSDASNVVGIVSQGQLRMISEAQHGTLTFASFEEGILKFTQETFSEPKKLLSYDLSTNKLTTIATQTFPVEVDAEKIYYTASNGQAASMWVLKKKGLKLNSATPLILYGYGGFKSSVTPAFGIYESLPWLEKGGAFAVVTLPGSLDYGMSWYKLAQVSGRTHAFDSFALAAKELFKRGWTSPEHIGMMGASNGGTLVAGTLQRHSEIFKAAVPIVGVMDLLNFSLFTAGKYWTDDYGNPFTEEGFRGIFPLSPYHNLKPRDYPAVMVMTAEFDDRVVPSHSYKYLARLQELNTSSAPILLYNKEWGGHARGSGSNRESSKYVAAYFTFFAQQLGL